MSRRGGLSAEVSKLLDELDMEPYSIDELIRYQGQYMTEYARFANNAQSEKRSMQWNLSDFICGKFVQDQDNVMKAAVSMNRLVTSMCTK